MADGRSSFANERPFTRRGVVEACKRAERAQEAEPQWDWRLRKRTGKCAFKRAGQRATGPRDQRTKGPKDQGTKGPRDQKTEGPEDQRTKDKRPKVHSPWSNGGET